jgi:hypothetical protein
LIETYKVQAVQLLEIRSPKQRKFKDQHFLNLHACDESMKLIAKLQHHDANSL